MYLMWQKAMHDSLGRMPEKLQQMSQAEWPARMLPMAQLAASQ
jgi:hypothetical protein